jgi:hypothetical protein
MSNAARHIDPGESDETRHQTWIKNQVLFIITVAVLISFGRSLLYQLCRNEFTGFAFAAFKE